MAFDRASDIIMDVMRAANPEKVEATIKRLQTGGASGAGRFDSLMDAARPTTPTIASRTAPAPSTKNGKGKLEETAVEFEALVLGNLISQMMPKTARGMFDHGPGSDMWNSLLSEQIGRQIAKTGRVGISQRLFATHPLPSSPQPTTTYSAAVGTTGVAS